MVMLKFIKIEPARKLKYEPVAHRIHEEIPHPMSWAAALLLREELGQEEAVIILKDFLGVKKRDAVFRRGVFKKERVRAGALICHHCKGGPLQTGKSSCYQHMRATVDHVVPISKGGARFDEMNVVIACAACNSERGNTDIDAYVSSLAVKNSRFSRPAPEASFRTVEARCVSESD
jgi:5-methylcytosine-specific restriction endonuclease McrA